jgi:hypothetical protein
VKCNRLVAELEARKALVDFPAPSSRSFHTWRASLLEVLAENDLGRDGWEWDESTGTFYTVLTDGARVGSHRGVFSITVALDPKQPLADEIDRLIRVRSEFRAACSRSVHRSEADDVSASVRALARLVNDVAPLDLARAVYDGHADAGYLAEKAALIQRDLATWLSSLDSRGLARLGELVRRRL